jgi:hypothetical protein
VILEDDGYPNLFDKYKEIRFDIGKIDIQNYKGPKTKKRNPDYDVIASGDFGIPYNPDDDKLDPRQLPCRSSEERTTRENIQSA